MALGLKQLPVAQKIEKARAIVTAMTNNPNFTSPVPALSVITTDANNLEAAALAAEGGGRTQTANMHAKEEILVRDLLALTAYVQVIANNNPQNAEAIITSANMNVKASASHGPASFKAVQTDNAGEVKLRIAYVRAAIYHWQMSTDQVNWTEVGVTRKGSFVKGGLNTGTRYYFRVAIETDSGIGPFNDPVSLLVA